ncbi:tyrosine-type recombinase/integrase, partial [Escherichia coli]|uniref:tyrosine-type recombinase/integrase n=1 Tax=Escherichia coli TaxID=562 RepID=UPI003EE0277F
MFSSMRRASLLNGTLCGRFIFMNSEGIFQNPLSSSISHHLDPIEQRGVLETLRRIISRLNEIFRYAATEELIEFNPADNLAQRFSKPKKQNMPALPPDELPRFMVALSNASIRLETRM